MGGNIVEPHAIIERIFEGRIPKESLVSKAHPFTKLFLIVFFPGMALFLSEPMKLMILLASYVLIMALSRKNPVGPWFIWFFVAIFGYLYYTMSPPVLGTKSLVTISVYPTKAYLLFAPILHVFLEMNPVGLVQVLPTRLRQLGVPILTFSRYIKVTKDQFIATRDAFRFRGIRISKSFFELFIVTLIVNIERHGKKYADNIEIRNLDYPEMLHDKPVAGVEDGVLCGICGLTLLVLVLFIN